MTETDKWDEKAFELGNELRERWAAGSSATMDDYHLIIVALRDAVAAETERCFKIIEEKERQRWKTIGDPRIPKFTPWMANALKE